MMLHDDKHCSSHRNVAAALLSFLRRDCELDWQASRSRSRRDVAGFLSKATAAKDSRDCAMKLLPRVCPSLRCIDSFAGSSNELKVRDRRDLLLQAEAEELEDAAHHSLPATCSGSTPGLNTPAGRARCSDLPLFRQTYGRRPTRHSVAIEHFREPCSNSDSHGS